MARILIQTGVNSLLPDGARLYRPNEIHLDCLFQHSDCPNLTPVERSRLKWDLLAMPVNMLGHAHDKESLLFEAFLRTRSTPQYLPLIRTMIKEGADPTLRVACTSMGAMEG